MEGAGGGGGQAVRLDLFVAQDCVLLKFETNSNFEFQIFKFHNQTLKISAAWTEVTRPKKFLSESSSTDGDIFTASANNLFLLRAAASPVPLPVPVPVPVPLPGCCCVAA